MNDRRRNSSVISTSSDFDTSTSVASSFASYLSQPAKNSSSPICDESILRSLTLPLVPMRPSVIRQFAHQVEREVIFVKMFVFLPINETWFGKCLICFNAPSIIVPNCGCQGFCPRCFAHHMPKRLGTFEVSLTGLIESIPDYFSLSCDRCSKPIEFFTPIRSLTQRDGSEDPTCFSCRYRSVSYAYKRCGHFVSCVSCRRRACAFDNCSYCTSNNCEAIEDESFCVHLDTWLNREFWIIWSISNTLPYYENAEISASWIWYMQQNFPSLIYIFWFMFWGVEIYAGKNKVEKRKFIF